MCGIFGILGPKADSDWIAEVVQRLFEESIPRGKDASGLAWVVADDDEEKHHIEILKKPEQGDKFQYDEDLLKILHEVQPKVLIGHVRKLSQGKAEDNENNHPLLSDTTGIALVHNGRVHDYLWKAKNDKEENPYVLGEFQAEVDTEAILRLIDTLLFIPRNEDGTIDPKVVEATPKEKWNYETPVPMLKAIDDAIFNLSGKNTCALLDPDEPDTIYAWKVENPLYIGYVPEQKAVVFASEEKFLKAALSKEVVHKLFDFIPVSKETQTMTYHGLDLRDTAVVRIHWTGEEGNEFQFEWILSDPDGADFSTVEERDRTVATNKSSDKVHVN
jgi:glucosamine 6-phosphate synthetase-like amidotransferase/phosphosugar isomerase protein